MTGWGDGGTGHFQGGVDLVCTSGILPGLAYGGVLYTIHDQYNTSIPYRVSSEPRYGMCGDERKEEALVYDMR